jgi:hypothetical protein
MLTDKHPWVRRQAEAAIENLEKSSKNGNGKVKKLNLDDVPVANVQEFERSKDAKSQLTHLQKLSQISEYLSEEILRSVILESRQINDPRIIGETCYALGRSNNPAFIPALIQLRPNPNSWAQKQANKAITILQSVSIISENDIQLQAYHIANTSERVNVLKEIRARIDDFSVKKLQVLLGLALDDYASEVRREACILLDQWIEQDRLQVAQFKPKLSGISKYDSDIEVQEHGAQVAAKLAIIKKTRIDFDLFGISDVYNKLQTFQHVSENLSEFSNKVLHTFISVTLRDSDPAIRGAAVQLLDKWTDTGIWKGFLFEQRIRRMAMEDPDLWVCKQAVSVARKLYWPTFYWQLLLILAVYAIIVLVLFLNIPSLSREIFSSTIPLVLDSDCNRSYAQAIINQFGTEAGEEALGTKDGNYASIGFLSDSELILDMGEQSPIVTGAGVDFYFYERPYSPGIQLDSVIISVAQDDGSGNPSSFIPVFVWGDNEPSNNGAIPSEYFPENVEIPNLPIPSRALYNKTGVGINIDAIDGLTYRFVRFQTYPSNEPAPRDELLTEVDAIEMVLCPPPSPSATSIVEPTETALTQIALPSETATFSSEPTEAATETQTPTLSVTPTPTLTVTNTIVVTPSETFTATLESTDSPTPSFTATKIIITTIPTDTLPINPTNTPTSTPLISSTTPTPTNTQTETPTITFTSSPTTMPTDLQTPTLTRQPRATRTATHALTIIAEIPTSMPTTLLVPLTLEPILTKSTTYTPTPTQASIQIPPVKTKAVNTITPLSSEIPEQSSVLARTLLQIILILLFILLIISVLVRLINWPAIQNRYRELFESENASHPFARANLLPDLLEMHDRIKNKLSHLVEKAIKSGLTKEGLTKEGIATELSHEITKLNKNLNEYNEKISLVRNVVDH